MSLFLIKCRTKEAKLISKNLTPVAMLSFPSHFAETLKNSVVVVGFICQPSVENIVIICYKKVFQ